MMASLMVSTLRFKYENFFKVVPPAGKPVEPRAADRLNDLSVKRSKMPMYLQFKELCLIENLSLLASMGIKYFRIEAKIKMLLLAGSIIHRIWTCPEVLIRRRSCIPGRSWKI